jgi:hypothetical protein
LIGEMALKPPCRLCRLLPSIVPNRLRSFELDFSLFSFSADAWSLKLSSCCCVAGKLGGGARLDVPAKLCCRELGCDLDGGGALAADSDCDRVWLSAFVC